MNVQTWKNGKEEVHDIDYESRATELSLSIQFLHWPEISRKHEVFGN